MNSPVQNIFFRDAIAGKLATVYDRAMFKAQSLYMTDQCSV